MTSHHPHRRARHQRQGLRRLLWALAVGAAVGLASCNRNDNTADAYGNFETDDVIVSAEVAGRLERLVAPEGAHVTAGATVGLVDTSALNLQRQRLLAEMAQVNAQLRNVGIQLEPQQAEAEYLRGEVARFSRLLADSAATQQQVADLQSRLRTAERRIAAQRSSLGTENQALVARTAVIRAQLAELANQRDKAVIRVPRTGVILERYAEPGEIVAFGRQLFRVAQVDTLRLRAYFSGAQLPQVRLNQTVTVRIDDGRDGYRSLPGRIRRIAAEAEFTPRNVQTKDERVDLVYAVDLAVPNPDGALKIGMPGEVLLQAPAANAPSSPESRDSTRR